MPIDFPEQLPLDDVAISTALARIKDPSPRTRFYLTSYPILLSIVASLDPGSRSSDVALAHLAYAWMPAALKATQFNQFDPQTLNGALAILNKTNFLNFITNLREPPINDSWVGSSKAFHLVRPCLFRFGI